VIVKPAGGTGAMAVPVMGTLGFPAVVKVFNYFRQILVKFVLDRALYLGR